MGVEAFGTDLDAEIECLGPVAAAFYRGYRTAISELNRELAGWQKEPSASTGEWLARVRLRLYELEREWTMGPSVEAGRDG